MFSFAFYLLLSLGSGSGFFWWSAGELLLGIVFSLLAAFVASRSFAALGIEIGYKALNPVRWMMLFLYLFPFFFALAKANLDVAYRVIIGKIRPGIVKINPKLKSGFGLAFLANSITLTPGTLTVEEKKGKLFVHWINVKEKKPRIEMVCGSFADWAGRIFE